MVDVQDKVLDFLAGSAIGLTRGDNLFGPELAPTDFVPVNAIFTNTSGGPEPLRTMGSNEVRSPIVNFLVRWNDYQGGRSKCLEVMNALQGAEISGLLFVALTEGEPDYVTRTEEGHHKWSFGISVDYNQDA